MCRAALLLLFVASSAHADRVAAARRAMEAEVRREFARANVAYPPPQLFVRAFKAERQLELWAGPARGSLVLVKTTPFCAASGELGPKRRRGDLQVPEGLYVIDRFNPMSNFLLSLRVSYPNASDRARGTTGDLGGDIYIHGGCASIGCIAIEDGPIQALYLAALDATRRAGRPVPVHIFPSRLDEAGLGALAHHPEATAEKLEFWRGLQPAYLEFERTRRVPMTSIDPRTGAYRLAPGAPRRRR